MYVQKKYGFLKKMTFNEWQFTFISTPLRITSPSMAFHVSEYSSSLEYNFLFLQIQQVLTFGMT